MDSVSQKNFKALSEGLKAIRALYEEQQKVITALQNQISELKRENAEKNNQALIIAAMGSNGNGPTVR